MRKHTARNWRYMLQLPWNQAYVRSCRIRSIEGSSADRGVEYKELTLNCLMCILKGLEECSLLSWVFFQGFVLVVKCAQTPQWYFFDGFGGRTFYVMIDSLLRWYSLVIHPLQKVSASIEYVSASFTVLGRLERNFNESISAADKIFRTLLAVSIKSGCVVSPCKKKWGHYWVVDDSYEICHD